MEEDLSRVISCSVEIVFLAGDNTRVTNRAEVNTELFVIVCTNVLIEYLRDTIDGLGLEDSIDGGIHFREIISTEDGNS